MPRPSIGILQAQLLLTKANNIIEVKGLLVADTFCACAMTWAAQSFYKLLTKSLFGESPFQRIFSRLTQNHAPSSIDIGSLLADLRSQDSDPNTNSFHSTVRSLILSLYFIPLLNLTYVCDHSLLQ